MIKDHITTEDVLALLNELVQLDAIALEQLVENRVPCNDALVAHPTVQTFQYPPSTVAGSTPNKVQNAVGLLGILNGLFGVYDDGPKAGAGPFTAVFTTQGQLTRFALTDNTREQRP